MFIKLSNKIKICKSIKSANSEVNKVMGIKYARELNCRERYHTRELMSFHFIFVANIIRDKNPLYGRRCLVIKIDIL